jgi:hypothetical protein
VEQANAFGHIKQAQAITTDPTPIKPDAVILNHQDDAV